MYVCFIYLYVLLLCFPNYFDGYCFSYYFCGGKVNHNRVAEMVRHSSSKLPIHWINVADLVLLQ